MMEEKIVDIFYYRLDQEIDVQSWKVLLARLPHHQQEAVSKYIHWQDRHRSLLGKLMLMNGLRELGMEEPIFDRIRYTAFGRPYINENIDFNISHSGELILFAQAKGMRLGIDIEKIKEIDFSDFRAIMNPDQWIAINQAPDPLEMFFTYWALKESVIKANGKGFSANPAQINTNFKEAWFENETWHLRHLDFGPSHKSYLATDTPDYKLEMRPFRLDI